MTDNFNTNTDNDSESYSVHVNNQIHTLSFDKSSMILLQKIAGSKPYYYPYKLITNVSVSAIDNSEYCLEVDIKNEKYGKVTIKIFFTSEEECKNASKNLPFVVKFKESSNLNSTQSGITSNVTNQFQPANQPISQPINQSQYLGHADQSSLENSHNNSYQSPNPAKSKVFNGGFSYDPYSDAHSTVNTYTSTNPEDMFDEDIPALEKFINFIQYPSDTFESVRKEEYQHGIIFGTAVLLLFSFVSVLINAFFAAVVDPQNKVFGSLFTSIPSFVMLVLTYFIFALLILFIYGLFVRTAAVFRGAEIDLYESISTTFYSAAPFGTIGLIPIVGVFVAPFWTVFLQIKGLSNRHELETGTAAFAGLLPAIVMFALFYYFIMSGDVVYA